MTHFNQGYTIKAVSAELNFGLLCITVSRRRAGGLTIDRSEKANWNILPTGAASAHLGGDGAGTD